ncbi:MAG: beta strand repeat-containing protein, partial [Leptothrix ochracea]|uniref:beta strand repeat-containing protein n=1 Tax=Leptothrix ochracea TaxID=735331 RepID=UPI0034E1EC37
NSAIDITGVEAGASVQYEIYTQAPTGVLTLLVGSAVAGTTYSLPSQMVNGAYSINVVVTDAAGNATTSTASYTLQGVPGPVVSLLSDTGSSATDLITANATLNIPADPTLTQTQYSVDGLTGWTATLPTWAEGLNKTYVRYADPAALLTPSLPTLFQFTLDTVAPVALNGALTLDSGTPGDGLTNSAAITLSGVEVGALVEYIAYPTGTAAPTVWTTATLVTNQFTPIDTVTGLPLAQATPYTVQVRQTDIAGNVAPTAQPVTLTLDTVAPVTPNGALTLDSGTPGDGLTNSAAITLSNVEVGALVEYIAYPTGTAAPTVWTTATLVTNQFTPIDTVTGLALVDATPYTVQIRQTDAAGNVSLSTQTVTLTLDRVAPATPGAALTLDSGTPGDGLTNLASVNVTGLEIGAIVEYISYIAGTPAPTTWRAVTPDALGNFVPTDAANAALINGVNYTVEVRQTDTAGNVSGTTGTVNFMLDTVAPAQPAAPNVTPAAGTNPTTLSVAVPANAIAGDVLSLVLTDAANTVITPTGTVALTAANLGGNVTFTLAAGLANGSYGATAQLTDLAGNASTASAAGSFAVGGTLPAAATITMVSDTGVSAVDHISSNAALNIGINAAATNVSYVLDGVTVPSYVAPTVDGPHTLTISGTGVVPVTFNFTLDRAALAPTLTLATDTGLYANDHISSSGLINVTGLDPNIYQVSYSIAPVVGGVVGQSSAGTITVTNGTAQIPAPTGDGIYQVTAQQLDKAGNSSTGTTLTYTLDTGALTPVLTLTDNLATPGTPQPLQGSTITSASLTPSAGGIETGAVLQYSLTGAAGTWADLATFTPSLGANALYVHQIDLAGNVSITSATPDVSFTLSTAGNSIQPPSITLVTDTGPGVIDPTLLTNTAINTDHLTAQPDLTLTPSNVADTLMYSVDGGTWTLAGAAGAFTLNATTDPINFGVLSMVGAHTVQAYETGPGGQSVATTYGITTDNVGPIHNIGGGGTPLSSDFQGLYISTSGATPATAVMRITYNEAVVINQGNQPMLMDPATGLPWVDPLGVNGTFTTSIANSGLSWDGTTPLGPQMHIQMDPITGQPMVDLATGLPIMSLVDIVEIRFTEATVGKFTTSGLMSAGTPTPTFLPVAEVLLTDTAGNIPGTIYPDWSTANTGFTTWQIHAMP